MANAAKIPKLEEALNAAAATAAAAAGTSGTADEAVNEGEQVLPEGIQVHETLPTVVGVHSGAYKWINPTTGMAQTGKIQFSWSGSGDRWLDLHNTFLYFTYMIRDSAGNPIRPAADPTGQPTGNNFNDMAKVLPVNGISYALFKDVRVELNKQFVDSGNMMYAHQADLEVRLDYSKHVKEGHLNMMGFSEETRAFDDLREADIPFDKAYNGKDFDEQYRPLMRRFKRTAASRKHEVVGRIHSPLFEQTKYIPPGIEVRVTFDRNDHKFVLLTKQSEEYTITIDEFRILARKVTTDRSLTTDVERVGYTGTPLVFPLRRPRLETYSVLQGSLDLGRTNILNGEKELPRRIIVGLLDYEAFFGNYGKDPFNYQHFKINSVGLRVGGQERPLPIIKTDFKPGSSKYSLALMSLLQAADKLYEDEELGIDMDNYTSRNTLFGFNMTALSLPHGVCYEEGEPGQTLDLILTLEESRAAGTQVIIYAEYDSELHIKEGRVLMHNHA